MTDRNPLDIIKAKQKRSQYSQHGREEVLSFEQWCPVRMREMKSEGFVIKSFEHDGVKMVGIKDGDKKPAYKTEEQFLRELDLLYTDVYLASFGLACKLPFEENAGIMG